jgi:DNA repair exonuclease SbcCD nuclease subunit
MKILATSDLHLSDKIWKHRPIEGDSYHSWRQIVDLAIEHDCDIVTLAGDILDKQTNVSNPVQELVAGLRRLREAHIKVWYNQGQHEYQTVPWMSLDETTVWVQAQPIVTTNGWNIAGCDYQNTEGLTNFLKTTAAMEADILVCHQVWLEFMGEECRPQGSFADIPENVRYLITGDYHENICQKFGQLTVLSPGSTHLRSISETEDKFVFFMELPDTVGSKAKTSTWPLATRRRF